MQQKLISILKLVLISCLISCKVYKPFSSTSGIEVSAEDYINKYKDLAVSEMKRTGVPASITLAQGMLESDYGRSRLAVEANNHFGIKCHNGWTGPTVKHHDDKRNECFRKYRKPQDSFYDHSDFLKSGSRYRSLFDIDPADYKAWARGLKRAGYATNPDYANLLIRKIEENKLYYFDQVKLKSSTSELISRAINDSLVVSDSDNNEQIKPLFNGNISVPAVVSRVKEKNRIQYIIVKDGDTKEKLEKEFQLLKWELNKYNEVKGDLTLDIGQILYLQPKRDKAEPGTEYHLCAEGETMYQISQKYGVKLKSLCEMNRMEEGREPSAGQKIWLRSVKPVN